MQFLVILLSALTAATKVTTQGYLARGNIKTPSDSVAANCLIFAFTCIIFSLSLTGGLDIRILPYALMFGLLSSLFQVCYAMGLKTGPFSITCMLVNLNMILPVIFSLIFFDEKLTFTKVLGMILCILALFLNTKSDGKKVNLKWFLYAFGAFLSTGAITITQKIFAKSALAGKADQFVFLGYVASLLISCIILLVQIGAKKEETQISFKLNKKTISLIALIAASLGAYQYIFTVANSFVPAAILTPSASGLATIFQILSGRIVFKDKFSPKQIFSICLGIIAILIISL